MSPIFSPEIVADSVSVGLHNNVSDVYEYDFGSGSPPAYALRHTRTDYLTVNPINGVNYADPANGSSYTVNDVHQRGLAKENRVYAVNPSNGVETLASDKTYTYDETAYTLTSGYPTVTQWTDPQELSSKVVY